MKVEIMHDENNEWWLCLYGKGLSKCLFLHFYQAVSFLSDFDFKVEYKYNCHYYKLS